MSIVNDRLIRALLRQDVDRTPVWMMRQAGRYLPEYRKLRAQVPDFMTFCRTTELACEVTLQPLARFDLDAAIVFSDILTVPEAMGMDLEFISGTGPVIHNPIRSMADVKQLKNPSMDKELKYVMQAVSACSAALKNSVPLIGFAGSPWTVATYMVEGGSSKLYHTIKKMLYTTPDILQALLQRVTDITIDYLNAQIAAGAQVLMLFDSWGGVLSATAYQQFSLNYMAQIADKLQRQKNGETVPLVFFTKGGGQWLEQIADAGCDALGLDWTTDIAHARQRVGDRVALQGNLDPMALFAKPEVITAKVNNILTGYGRGSGHVFNLGHGIDKDTPIAGVEAMLAAVHGYRYE